MYQPLSQFVACIKKSLPGPPKEQAGKAKEAAAECVPRYRQQSLGLFLFLRC